VSLPARELIVRRLIAGAVSGDYPYIKDIFDRLEGKPGPQDPPPVIDLRTFAELLDASGDAPTAPGD
jgi:hypothetical protein